MAERSEASRQKIFDYLNGNSSFHVEIDANKESGNDANVTEMRSKFTLQNFLLLLQITYYLLLLIDLNI